LKHEKGIKTAQEFINPDDPPTFEKVWKMFEETDRRFQETREQIAATDRQMKETDKKVGELTNRFGDMVEYMVVPNLLAKFKALDFAFEVAHKNTEMSLRGVELEASANRRFVEPLVRGY
jgi:hypothetical protein